MRKTELFFDSIADDFRERMNEFDQQARVDWFDRALSTHVVAGSRMIAACGAAEKYAWARNSPCQPC